MPMQINFSKAQELTKDRLRKDRQPLLEEQDVLYMRTQESGGDTTAIVTEKNRLRDITKLADSATTLDELKSIGVEK